MNNKGFYFLLSTILIVLIASCRRLPNVQGKGELFLQGKWQQDSIANYKDFLNFTTHAYKFTCDSFYVDLTTFSKVNYYEEACYNNGVWKEYAKGRYKVSGDTISLVGVFTKENYKQKISGCYRNGQYLVSYKIIDQKPSQLVLEDINDHKTYNFNLKEKINCIQKAL